MSMSPTLVTILRRPLTADCLRDTAYAVVAIVTGVVGFSFVISAASTAFSLAIVIVGLPLAVLVAHVDKWWCRFERTRAAQILGRPVTATYLPPRGDSRLGRWLSILSDPQTWYDGVWLIVSLPLGVATFALTASAWWAVFALLTQPIFDWSLPPGVDFAGSSIVAPLLAPLVAVVGAWLVHGAVFVRARIAAALLGPRRADVLQQRVETLSETRAGAVDASVTELQRVERDLHDGAQARLVALAMDLGMAEQRLANADPATALEHVTAARGQARAAMADLRDLVRGIAPSILNDRGLDAALTALISGRNPPVELRVELRGTEVTARETAAYFVVAEALTNARKHAEATRISVRVWEDAADRLVAEVVDDGVGGADPESGSGLTGLRKRVAALDGTLTVTSPSGGPTMVRAELPCAS